LTDDEKKQLFDIGKTSRRGTQGEKGTGLGMVICKEFVEKCHGKIWAAPNQPTGTAFYFTVPVNAEAQTSENKEKQ
jgi:K+-sensing histidine kinase KdpD